ncbi:MAG: MBL fold metallo-hydrolase [Bacteroidetes bacterium]|nr:MBL fold metallo-hydrolase [Bacteroidota bacterium]
MSTQITIHRGASTIGGTCIEISSGKTRIILDLGMPLTNENETIDKLEVELDVDGVLISHPHQDHYGLIDLLPDEVPVYTGPIAAKLFQSTRLFLGKPLYTNSFREFTPWQTFEIGSFKITPHLMDHSAVDAYAFEIECEGKRLFYSGDFRAHGRKSKLFDKLVQHPPKEIDVLFMEGTMLARDNKEFPDEAAVEDKMVETLCSDSNAVFLLSSSQNIDRIVSAYRASKRSGRIFVVDIYTAWILEKIAEISGHTPKIDWPMIKVLSKGGTAAKHYLTVKNNADYFGHFVKKIYQPGNMITCEEIAKNPAKYFIKTSSIQYLKNQMNLGSVRAIYSMWPGYLDEQHGNSYSYLPKLKEDLDITLVHAHTSGHAETADLIKFAEAINPEKLIPIHTEHGMKYDDIFRNVYHLDNGKTLVLV